MLPSGPITAVGVCVDMTCSSASGEVCVGCGVGYVAMTYLWEAPPPPPEWNYGRRMDPSLSPRMLRKLSSSALFFPVIIHLFI